VRPEAERLRSNPRLAAVAAGGLLAAVAIWLYAALHVPTPWIVGDELLYAELARSFIETGSFSFREAPVETFAVLYPILISPAWLVGAMETTYPVAKALNVVMMVSTAVPVYLWARRLAPLPHALAVGAIVLVSPALLYSGTLMSENAFYPVFVVASFLLALALERRSAELQVAALAAIALACSVRTQALALLVVVPAAVALKIVLDARAEGRHTYLVELRRYWVLLGGLGIVAVAYAIVALVTGSGVDTGLGSYSVVAERNYDLGAAARWCVYHAGGLVLACGAIPLFALAALAYTAVRRPLDPPLRAFVAVATPTVVVVVIASGVFASRFAGRIEERYMIPLVPVLVLALLAWGAVGAPRPRLVSAAAIGTAGLLVWLLPIGALLGRQIVSDTFSLIPLWRVALSPRIPGGNGVVEVLVVLGVLAAGALFVLVPRRYAATLLLAAVGVYLAAVSYASFRPIRDYSVFLHSVGAVGENEDWVDDRIGHAADASYFYVPSLYREVGFVHSLMLWETSIWNRSVRSAYAIDRPDPEGIPFSRAKIDLRSGLIRTDGTGIAAKFAVADFRLPLAGEVLERHGDRTLVRLDKPVGITARITGMYGDGWMGSTARMTQYRTPGDRPGRATVTLSRAAWIGKDVPGAVRIRVGPLVVGEDGAPRIGRTTATARGTIHAGGLERFSLRTPPPPFVTEVRIEPTFSPSDFGLVDTRDLGAQASFGFEPSESAPR
jgi:hypothetical protein